MVDVTFQKRAPHFVSLSLLKRIGANSPKPPTDVEYIGKEGAEAIKGKLRVLVHVVPESDVYQQWHCSIEGD